MIVRLVAAITGLLTFVGMLLAGVIADNPLTTILLRALAGLACGLAVGALAGWVALTLLRENLQRILAADAALDEAQGPSVKDMEEKQSGESELDKEARESVREHTRAPDVESPAQRAARQVLQEL